MHYRFKSYVSKYVHLSFLDIPCIKIPSFSGAKDGPGESAIRLSDERDPDLQPERKLRPEEC